MADLDLERALSTVNDKYPALAGLDVAVRRGRGPGHAEFYPANELGNPVPGKSLIEVRNADIKGEFLESLLGGELLHELRLVDKTFDSMSDKFVKSLSKRQMENQHQAYQYAQENFGEEREFKDWFEVNRIDALMRGYLFPDEDNNFSGSYSKENIEVLQEMRAYIEGTLDTDEES
jgi:hypothetical protein